MNADTVREFVRRINEHSPERLSELMTDDHRFVDAHGNTVRGRENAAAGWRGYFEWFPDYTIELEATMESGGFVGAFGSAAGAFRGAEETPGAQWKLPASWRAVVEGGRIALWQVYADTKIPFEILSKYSAPGEQKGSGGVLGLGGVFFKSRDKERLRKWYDEHLGTSFGGGESHTFLWREPEDQSRMGMTVLAIFAETTDYFKPGAKPFMLNYRVGNLEAFLKKLREEGVKVVEKTETYEYGKFGWIIDPEGNKIELWEPTDEIPGG